MFVALISGTGRECHLRHHYYELFELSRSVHEFTKVIDPAKFVALWSLACGL